MRRSDRSESDEQPQIRRKSRRLSGGLTNDELRSKPVVVEQETTEDEHEEYKGRGIVDTEEEDIVEPPRRGTSVIRRDTAAQTPRATSTGSRLAPVPPRRASLLGPQQPTSAFPTSDIDTQRTLIPYPQGSNQTGQNRVFTGNQKQKQRWRDSKVHWLLPIGIGMIAMLILWEVGSLALSWGTNVYNNVVYGNPRTYQTNAVVGHGGDSPAHPSHFIAVNLNGQAIVIEFPAGNPQNASSYLVPYYIRGQGEDQAPVTVDFRDVTGDGKVDMIVSIHLPSQIQTFVFVNDGTKFRAPNSSDHIHL
jgi:hypothetical protein